MLGRKLGRYQDPRVVPTDVENLVALQIQVAVEGFGKTSPDTYFMIYALPLAWSLPLGSRDISVSGI
jgi:hypothetical protein